MAKLNTAITTEIESQINSERLILPTLPELALQARETAEREDVTIHDLADIVRLDAAMSAKLIKIANSPAMRTRTPATDLHSAMARLGLNFCCNLITGLAMAQMFQSTSEVIDQALRTAWSASTAIAGLASVIARRFTTLPPDEAALAGLTHLIGALPILTFIENCSQSYPSARELENIISELHPELGRKILTNWGFPGQLAQVPEKYYRFSRNESSETDFADIIMIANLVYHSLGNQSLTRQEIPNWQSIPAFNRAGIATDPESQHSPDFDPLKEEFELAIKTFQ